MRDVLKTLLLASMASGCSSDPPSSDTFDSGCDACEVVCDGPCLDRSVPASLSDVRHLVIIYLENRSFDHLYGSYPGAEGLSSSRANIAQVDDSTGLPYSTLPHDFDDQTLLSNAPFDITRFFEIGDTRGRSAASVLSRAAPNQWRQNGQVRHARLFQCAYGRPFPDRDIAARSAHEQHAGPNDAVRPFLSCRVRRLISQPLLAHCCGDAGLSRRTILGPRGVRRGGSRPRRARGDATRPPSSSSSRSVGISHRSDRATPRRPTWPRTPSTSPRPRVTGPKMRMRALRSTQATPRERAASAMPAHSHAPARRHRRAARPRRAASARSRSRLPRHRSAPELRARAGGGVGSSAACVCRRANHKKDRGTRPIPGSPIAPESAGPH